jgi:peptidase E
MSKFFESEQVMESIKELEKLQNELSHDIMNVSNFATTEEKKEHINKMKTFLEKQKLFFFRVSLSDDPEALEIKNRVLEAAKMFGFNEMDGMGKFFEQMDKTLAGLESQLDR